MDKIEENKWYKIDDVKHLFRNYVGRYFLIKYEYNSEGDFDLFTSFPRHDEKDFSNIVFHPFTKKNGNITHVLLTADLIDTL